MYECPIQKITRELQTQITQQDEEQVLLEVKQSVGFFVDKEELITALSYDREQYQKGYADGLRADKWIPVSERLPEEAFGCLVTILDTDLKTQDEFENILPYAVGYDGETWNNFCGEPIPFEVIAWMPLPKPYEPRESEE